METKQNSTRDYSYFLAYKGYKSELITKLLNDALIYSSVSKNLSDENHCIYSGEIQNPSQERFFVYGRINGVQRTSVTNKSYISNLLFYAAYKMLSRNKVMDINALLLSATLTDYCDPEYISQIKNIIDEGGINESGYTNTSAVLLREQCLATTEEFIKKNGTILHIPRFLDVLFADELSADVRYKWLKVFNMERYEYLKSNGKISVLSLYDGRLSKRYIHNDAAIFGNMFDQYRDAVIAKIRNYIHNDLNECVANNHVHDSKLYKAVINFLNSPYTKSEYYIPTVIAFNRLIKKVLKVNLSFDHLSSIDRSAEMKLEFIKKFLSIDEITNGKNLRNKFIPTSLSIAKEHAIADMKLSQVLHDWYDL